MITITGISPAPGSEMVLSDTLISFTLIGLAGNIDISTLIVELNGIRVIDAMTFATGYAGISSEILPSFDNYIVTIQKETPYSIGQNIFIKIQVKDFSGLYMNESYLFHIIPNEPVLIRSTPTRNENIFQKQLIVMEFNDSIDGVDPLSLSLSINNTPFITAGLLDSVNGPASLITTSTTGVLIQIDFNAYLDSGKYNIDYSISDTLGNALVGSIPFVATIKTPVIPSNFNKVGFLGFFQGITKAWDLGIGTSVQVEWGTPIVRSKSYEPFILLYNGASKLTAHDSPPDFISLPTQNSFVFDGLKPNKTRYFSVRALESVVDVFNFSNLTEKSPGIYAFPVPTSLLSVMSDVDLVISVASVSGFPASGLVQVGTEVMRYNSLSTINNTFSIPTKGRGLFGSQISIHQTGDLLSLHYACNDYNDIIVATTPTFQDGFVPDRVINSTGILIPDFTENDKNFFQGFDFCGYHQAMPQYTLTGQNDCGSYLGGEFNGFKGFNIYDRMLNREEVLLDQTGEPTLLLSRIWDGVKCSCSTSRRNSPKLKSCKLCFGTTFDGGYLQYCNLRREDRRVMMSFSETVEDLKLSQMGGLQQEFEPSAWTLPQPAIKDRDILIRFDFSGNIEYMYEVLTASREKLMYKHFGRQKLALKRMDKTDIIYTLVSTALLNNDFCPVTTL